MRRVILDGSALAVILLAGSTAGAQATVRTDVTQCNTHICTADCPTVQVQQSLCAALGDCFPTEGCPEDTHGVCTAGDALTLCWSN